MDLPPSNIKRKKGGKEEIAHPRRNRPYVRWIATFVGVLMVAIGILLILWSFAWMAAPEPGPLEDTSGLSGGPGVMLVGFLFLGFGGMWLYNGYHDFPRRGEEQQHMQGCPKCNRRIEADLDFCYYCGEQFGREEEQADSDMDRKPPRLKKRIHLK